MPSVTAMWRHPIKAHGREQVEDVLFTKSQTMPWDRRWAVAHELSDADNLAWSSCSGFSRAAKVPALMAIATKSDVESGIMELSHPLLPTLRFDPDKEEQSFLEWVRPLMPQNRPQSVRLVRVPGRGMTDTDFASVSLINLASNDAMSKAMSQDISPLRWRGNIHLSGLQAWEEFDLVGKTIRIGEAEFEVEERITRCLATHSNPETGIRDAGVLATLDRVFDHQEFGVNAIVVKTGRVAVGDTLEIV